MKRRKKWTLRRVLSLGLAVLMIVGAVAGIAAVTKRLTADQKTISPTFERGGIDTKTGRELETNGSLYTPEAFSAKGLQIKLDFDAHLSYQIFWYNAQGQFSYASDVYMYGGEHYCPANYKCRIVLTPIWSEIDDEDQEIGWYEVWSYTSKVEITIDKDQTFKYTEYGLRDLVDKGIAIYTEGGVRNPITGEIEHASNTNRFECFSFVNNGVCSSVYFDTKDIDQSVLDIRLFLITNDGQQKLYYYNEISEMTHDRAGYIPTVDTPLYVPEGYGITVYMNNAQVDPETVFMYLY